jgi:hypothetical protein
MTVSGIDVSAYQPTAYSTADLAFVVVKATEGVTYVNPKHSAQVAWGRAHGLVIGHYHFQRAGSVPKQVAHFAAHAGVAPGDFIALDWEDVDVSCMSKDEALRQLQARFPHNRVVLYCNRDFWLNRDRSSFCGDGLWIADPTSAPGHPRISHGWLIHQHSDAGGIDRDVAGFADEAALRTWAAKGRPAVPPAPVAHPRVDLSNLVAAARTDPAARQGHQTHAGDVHLVEAALKAEHLLPAAYAGDGSYGSTTVAAYAAWQRRLGYTGRDADGTPGKTSLTELGRRHGFTVTA